MLRSFVAIMQWHFVSFLKVPYMESYSGFYDVLSRSPFRTHLLANSPTMSRVLYELPLLKRISSPKVIYFMWDFPPSPKSFAITHGNS